MSPSDETILTVTLKAEYHSIADTAFIFDSLDDLAISCLRTALAEPLKYPIGERHYPYERLIGRLFPKKTNIDLLYKLLLEQRNTCHCR